jgi:hypothetical protein
MLGASPADTATTSIAKPAGRVMLTISGNIQQTNSENGVEFDRSMLEAIGLVELVTETPFIDGETVFRGVRMRDLLRFVGAEGTVVKAEALNLYAVDIPIADFEKNDAILALEVNGRKLRVRNRGPAWIMYPFSDDPSLDNEAIYARCVWQLASLVVR